MIGVQGVSILIRLTWPEECGPADLALPCPPFRSRLAPCKTPGDLFRQSGTEWTTAGKI